MTRESKGAGVLDVLRRHLRQHASRYFRDLSSDDVRIVLERRHERALATLYFFRLQGGGCDRQVVVKVLERGRHGAADEHASRGLADVPRLGVRFDPEERARLEQTTLAAIHGYFAGLGDDRFGTIRPLDTLGDHLATVMERAAGVSLRDLLVRSAFGRAVAGRRDLRAELANAGAWLAHYHRHLETGHAATRRATRDDFLASIRELAGYLGLALERPGPFDEIARSTEEVAAELLPHPLPLGLGHGDFAPRNVLVGPSGKVTVLDTLGRWRIPIYEDLAYFLVGVKSLGIQIASMGRALSPQLMQTYEGAFLWGYFGDEEVPHAQIQLFEIESVLARWASAAHRSQLARGIGRLRRRAELTLKDRFFGRLVSALLSDLAVVRDDRRTRPAAAVS